MYWNYNRFYNYAKESDALKRAVDEVLPKILEHLKKPEWKFYAGWAIDVIIPYANGNIKWTYIKLHSKDCVEMLSILTEDLEKIIQEHGATASIAASKPVDLGSNPSVPASIQEEWLKAKYK